MTYHMISEVPFRSGGYDGPGILGGFGEGKAPACPPFRFICTCPSPDVHCKARRQYLCDRILGAINLAKKAASLLEVKPSLSPSTVIVFRQIFDQAPNEKWEVPGNPSRTISAGELVARRFRAVADELRTSDTIYRCVDEKRCQDIQRGKRCTTDFDRNVEVRPRLNGFGITERQGGDVIRPDLLPERPSPYGSCHPTDTIVDDTVAKALLCKNEVWLCPGFWTPPPPPAPTLALKKLRQEGTILHEMFHLCFGVTCSWFQHDPQKERRRNNAYCYEVFAIGGAAAADKFSVAKCKASPV